MKNKSVAKGSYIHEEHTLHLLKLIEIVLQDTDSKLEFCV